MLLRGARLAGAEAVCDLGVEDGLLAPPEAEAKMTIDLCGRLVTPALVEPHIHLDAALTAGQPRANLSGSLFEGIAIWSEHLSQMTEDEVRRRALAVLGWELASGVQHVRSHVDVCDPQLRALEALLQVREEAAGQIDLQLVAFPQQGIMSFPDGVELMRRAVKMGVDVVGAIPHFEMTREQGVESVRFAIELACEHGLMVDIHCDETDDEQSRFSEVMAAETVRLGMEGRVTASHTTAMHSYNGAYASRLIANIARAQMHMVTNPLDNSVLQGRFDGYPVRRGHTRIKELMAAGVNVCVGHDSVMDPWYPLGIGDPLQAAFVLAHLGQMTGAHELDQLLEMVTLNPARALGLTPGALELGAPADLVVFEQTTWFDALRRLSPRHLVLRQGQVVARSQPSHTTLVWDGSEQEVDFGA
ncbi:MAG TPA: cytosine deaminase [Candidatus Nitrosotalea sp.]|nr:cytosine deaminase [Candidatus Nitrosotalea sp.]